MRNLIISDTVLIGGTLDETMAGIDAVNRLRTNGNNIIILSNRPYKCMRPICVDVVDGIPKYTFDGSLPTCKSGSGIPIYISDNSLGGQNVPVLAKTIRYNYSIFGAGAFIINQQDELIHEGRYMDSKTLSDMTRILKERGYRAPGKEQVSDGSERLYKFFRFDKEYIIPNKATYGMQCSSDDLEYEETTIKAIMDRVPMVEGFMINGKPCFYRRDNNKIFALHKMMAKGILDPKKMHLFLGDETEQHLARTYGKRTTVIENVEASKLSIETGNRAPSLIKALDKFV